MRNKRIFQGMIWFSLVVVILLNVPITRGFNLGNIGTYELITEEIGGRKYNPNSISKLHIIVKVNLDNDLSLSKNEFDFRKVKAIKDMNIVDSGIDYLKTTNYNRPIYKRECITQRTYMENQTGINEQVCNDVLDHYELAVKYEWLPFDNINFKKNEDLILDFWFKRKIELGEFSIDIIPKISNYELSKLAWWNVSCNYNRLLNVSENEGVSKNYYPVHAIIDTSGGNWGDGNETRVIQEINGVQEEVLYNWYRFGNSDSVLWFEMNLTANSVNNTAYVYYDCDGFDNHEGNVSFFAENNQAVNNEDLLLILNENEGINVNDISSNNCDGSFAGAGSNPTWFEDRYGIGINLTDGHNIVESNTGCGGLNSNDVTIQIIIRERGDLNGDVFGHWSQDYKFNILNGKIGLSTWGDNSGENSNIVITDGWGLYTSAWDEGTSYIFYKNGTNKNTDPTGDTSSGTDVWRIGEAEDQSSEIDLHIYEIRVFTSLKGDSFENDTWLEPEPSVILGSEQSQITTTTTIPQQLGNYTSYFCSGNFVVKNITQFIDNTSIEIFEYTDCEYNCSSYLGRARCNYEPFVVWIIFIAILLILVWVVKTIILRNIFD